jgi:hypothetical protein
MEYPTVNQELETGTVLWEDGIIRREGKNYYFVNVRCGVCSAVRPVAIVDTRRQSGICAKCRRHKHYSTLNNKRGEQSSRYKSRRRINQDGYAEVSLYPGDEYYDKIPCRQRLGKGYVQYVAEHRLVMAQKLGRVLEQWEHVHHIDGNKTNNHPDNLEIVSSQIHATITALMKENTSLKKELSDLRSRIAMLQQQTG